MSTQAVYEIIGYAASVLVAISLTMSSVVRLRIINLLGAATFAVYGLLIQAYPVAAVNLLIMGINVFHLRRMLSTRESFSIVEMPSDSAYLLEFLRFYRDQIARFFPRFTAAPSGGLALFVLRDLVPAGLLLGDVEGDILRVRLDFVIPQYRDLKVGRYLFHERCAYFAERGIRTVVAEAGTREHREYLAKIGFAPDGPAEESAVYRLALAC